MKHFSIAELTRSATATQRGIDNTPSPAQEANLITLVDKVLDPIREKWGAAINVNSGFRSSALNSAVGGATASQHLQGKAADITSGTPEKNKQLFDLILDMGLEFDQLIDESNFTWIHISYNEGANRNQSLKL